jgi:hypothetical protein
MTTYTLAVIATLAPLSMGYLYNNNINYANNVAAFPGYGFQSQSLQPQWTQYRKQQQFTTTTVKQPQFQSAYMQPNVYGLLSMQRGNGYAQNPYAQYPYAQNPYAQNPLVQNFQQVQQPYYNRNAQNYASWLMEQNDEQNQAPNEQQEMENMQEAANQLSETNEHERSTSEQGDENAEQMISEKDDEAVQSPTSEETSGQGEGAGEQEQGASS